MAALQDIVNGVFMDLAHAKDPRSIGHIQLPQAGALGEPTARGFFLNVMHRLLTQNKTTRAHLSHNGGVRVTKDEVLGKVRAARLH